jgi:hypothetical protein
MEQQHEPEPVPEPDYRRLPPRITADEMIETQPLVQAVQRAEAGNDTEWEIRKAAG